MTAPTPDPIEIGGDSSQTPNAGRDQRGLRLAVGGAIAALVAVVGVFAALQLTAASSAGGGAESPEAVVAALFDALADENLDAAVELLAPDERESLGGPLYEAIDELIRIGLFSDDLDTSSISGIDAEVRALDLRVEPVADDLANVYATGELVVTVTMRDLPLGSGLAGFLASMGDDLVEPESEPIDTMITTVAVDGRWFVSIFHTMGEESRLRDGIAPIPSGAGTAPRGAPSPDALVDQLVAAIEAEDADWLIALMNPREVGALHRYASLMTDDSDSELSTETRIEDFAYRVDVSGDRAVVHLDAYTMVSITESPWGTDTFYSRYEDGCVTTWNDSVDEHGEPWDTFDEDHFDDEPGRYTPDGVTYANGRYTYCPDEMGPTGLGLLGMGLGAGGLPSGLHLERIDGEWYLSPVTTYTEGVLDTLRSLDDNSAMELIGGVFMNPMGSSGSYSHSEDYSTETTIVTHYDEGVEDYPTESTAVTDLDPDERSTPDTTWKADDRQLPPVDE